jgi:hypothetical protein
VAFAIARGHASGAAAVQLRRWIVLRRIALAASACVLATCSPHHFDGGCAPGESCTWIVDTADAQSTIGHVGCAPAGSEVSGGTCTRNAPGPEGWDDCERGDYCLGPATAGSGTCAVICDVTSASPNCPNGTTCTDASPAFGQPPVAGLCE